MVFGFEQKLYRIHILNVLVYPQCYAAVAGMLPTFGKKALVIDVGSWTVDSMLIVNKKPDNSRCDTQNEGLINMIALGMVADAPLETFLKEHPQISSMKEQQASKSLKETLSEMVDRAQARCRQMKEKLFEVKEEMHNKAAEIVKSVKQKGKKALNKVSEFFGVKKKLESIRENVREGIVETDQTLARIEGFGEGMRMANEQLANSFRVLAGKEQVDYSKKEYAQSNVAVMEAMEKDKYRNELNEQEKLTLEYLSKTILSGVRPDELAILKQLLACDIIEFADFAKEYKQTYGYEIQLPQLQEAVQVLQGCFVSKESEYQKFCHIDILEADRSGRIRRLSSYAERLAHAQFYMQLEDIIKVGVARYKEKYLPGKKLDTPFVLYEKYSRKDVSLLMNCGKDLSSVMYGMKRIDEDVFIFITYHKEEAQDEKNYVEGNWHMR